MNRPARLAIAFVVWLLVAATLATVMFILVWVVAGPHSGLLPRPLEIAVWVAGYAVILIMPLVTAVFVYRKLRPDTANSQQVSA